MKKIKKILKENEFGKIVFRLVKPPVSYLYIYLLKKYRFSRSTIEILIKTVPFINKLFRPWPIPNSVKLLITYECNLMCINCNYNCSQAPSKIALSLVQINKFIDESIKNNYQWDIIYLSGGEPTLHKNIFEIIDVLLHFKNKYSDKTQIYLATNNFSQQTKDVLQKLPKEVQIKYSTKTSNKNKFHPINLAPRDSIFYKYANYSLGCEGVTNCGIALGPYGYYPCPYHSGFDRVLQFRLGKMSVKEVKETYLETNKVLCSYCGAWRIARSTNKWKVSHSWAEVFSRYSNNQIEMEYY